MKKISWRAQMSVDNGMIDEDHKILIGYINDFLSMSDLYNHCSSDIEECEGLTNLPCGEKSDCHKKCMEIMASLKFYTSSHFKREEALQQEIGFPIQSEGHNNLIEQLNDMIEKLKKPEDFIKHLKGVGNFFNKWLIEHIIKEDLKMKPYFKVSHAKSVRYLSLDGT